MKQALNRNRSISNLSLIILAGGISRRMRCRKAHLKLPDGQTLVEFVYNQARYYFDDIVVSSREKMADISLPGGRFVVDEIHDAGPIMGLVSGLENIMNDQALVLACDIPLFPVKIFEIISSGCENYEMIVPKTGDGHLQPLCAIYSRTVASLARSMIANSDLRILNILDRCRSKIVSIPEEVNLQNLNTVADYRHFCHHFSNFKRLSAPHLT